MQPGQATGFLTGFLHPISGLDHVLAMVAVGLWGAQLGAPAIWVLPVAFPLVMAFGGFLGLLGVPLPGVEFGIAASAILLGAAVMSERRPPLVIAAALVGCFAIFHGHAHGTELPPGAERAALQHGLRRRDRMPARDRHRDRRDPPLASRSDRAAHRGWRRRTRRHLLPVAGNRDETAAHRAAASAARGLALTAYAQLAHAHLIETGLGPVYDGIAHFALTPEDLIPALALAVLAGLRGTITRGARSSCCLWRGYVAGRRSALSAKVSLPDSLSWVPLLVLGGLVAADVRLPAAATTALAAALGLFLGLANGYAMAQAGPGVRGVVGIVGAVFVVTTLGAACAVAWQSGWLRIAWRVAGSWIAASGLLLAGWTLR